MSKFGSKLLFEPDRFSVASLPFSTSTICAHQEPSTAFLLVIPVICALALQIPLWVSQGQKHQWPFNLMRRSFCAIFLGHPHCPHQMPAPPSRVLLPASSQVPPQYVVYLFHLDSHMRTRLHALQHPHSQWVKWRCLTHSLIDGGPPALRSCAQFAMNPFCVA